MHTARILIVALACSALSTTPATAQVPSTTAIEELQSPKLTDRIRGFYLLDRTPTAWANPTAARLLMSAMLSSDSILAAVARHPAGGTGIEYRDDEEFAEYEGQVQTRCFTYCNRELWIQHILHDIATEPELRRTDIEVLAAIYGDNGLTSDQRARIHSAFIAAAADPSSLLIREAALGAIGEALRSGRPSVGERERLHRAVIAAASDPYTDVRLRAVLRLSESHDLADRVLLQQMATNDTARVMKAGMAVYPVREAARKAIGAAPRAP